MAQPSATRIGNVKLNGAVFYAFHGVSEGERKLGAQYQVDVSITADLAAAARGDQLSEAINYQVVYDRVSDIVTNQNHKLLETIAARIVDDLFAAFPAALEVAVAVRKLNAPINGIVASAEVELHGDRSSWKPLS